MFNKTMENSARARKRVVTVNKLKPHAVEKKPCIVMYFLKTIYFWLLYKQ